MLRDELTREGTKKHFRGTKNVVGSLKSILYSFTTTTAAEHGDDAIKQLFSLLEFLTNIQTSVSEAQKHEALSSDEKENLQKKRTATSSSN